MLKKAKIDHQSPTPLHIQAEQIIRKMINSDDYRNGKMFPNEVEFSKELGISRNTLRQAINKLVYEGLLIRKKGHGTKVNYLGTTSSASKNWLSFSQEMKALGVAIKNFELHISWKKADPDVANFFGIKPNDRLLQLIKVRGKQDGPIVYFISYFAPEIGMTGEEDFSMPLYEMLEQEYGVVVKTSLEEISALNAPELISEKLQIEKGDAVLKRKRYVLDTDGKPVEYNIGYYRADAFSFKVESER